MLIESNFDMCKQKSKRLFRSLLFLRLFFFNSQLVDRSSFGFNAEGFNYIKLLPGSHIRLRTSSFISTCAFSTKERWQAVLVDLLEQLFLVGATQNLDLCNGFFIQKSLNDWPASGENERRVDHKHCTHIFRVIITSDFSGCLEKSSHLTIHHSCWEAGHVHYRQACVDSAAGYCGGSGISPFEK